MSRTDHLAKAKDYIAKGEDFYRKAAEEIVAAIEEDSTLSYREIGAELHRDESWVRRLVRSFTSAERAPEDGPLVVEWNSGSNKRDEVVGKALRDPEKRREAIANLDYDERMEVMREVSRSVPPLEPSPGREGEREIFKSVRDAPEHDLSARAAKFVLVASQIGLLLAEGAELRRMNAKDLQRLDRDLDRVKDTAEQLQEQIAAQSRVRRIA